MTSESSNEAAPRRRIFLSYRRDDCAVHAGRLADNLTDRASADVFFDVDTVKLGEDFVKAIEREVTRCDMVIVMIGDDWLVITGRDGRPRIQDPRDFVHVEVRMALERDIPVIPVLVEGAKMPHPDQLPWELRDLAFRHAAELREGSWTQDFERLAGALPGPAATSAAHPEQARTAVSVRQPERASIDFVAARAFIESIPAGRWSTYQEVARAGGSPAGVMAIGNWLRAQGDALPHVWRVLTHRGEVSEGWAPQSPQLPSGHEAVRELLVEEGVLFDAHLRAAKHQLWRAEESAESGAPSALDDGSMRITDPRTADTVIVAGRLAYPDYLFSGAYICQAGRSFQPAVEHLGFYAAREIKREIPRILHRRDDVMVTPEHAAELRGRSGPFDVEVAQLIEKALDPSQWRIRRELGRFYQFFLLSHPDGEETVVLPYVVWHGGRSAWTQGQRYASLEALRAAPSTTDEL